MTKASETKYMILNTDAGVRAKRGDSNGPATAAFVLTDAYGNLIREGGIHIGVATTNEAEYSALILGMYNAYLAGATHLAVLMDSQLVINQMAGNWEIQAENLLEYHCEAKMEEERFVHVTYSWVRRSNNKRADEITRRIFEEARKEEAADGD